ncbi:cytochrome P450 family protein [Pleurotus pulmonarius]
MTLQATLVTHKSSVEDNIRSRTDDALLLLCDCHLRSVFPPIQFPYHVSDFEAQPVFIPQELLEFRPQMLSEFSLTVLALLFSLVGLQRWRKPKLPLPPGPKGYPIVGNLFKRPTKNQWMKYLEWSKEFNSDVICFRVFGKPTIVLNSRKAINDLLLVRSSLYSDRPRSTMINELLENFFHHISYSLSASAISIAYGLDVKPTHDPNIGRCEAAIGQLNNAALDGDYLVDTLPMLKYIPTWMPGAGFKAYAEKARPKTLDMFNTPFIEACDKIRDGVAEQSIVSSGLARGGYSIDDHPDQEVIRDVASITYAGGAETSHLALKTFVAAMLLYPDLHDRAQQELDAYVGSQLPTFDDLPHMPYVHAIMLEVLRWQAVLPLAIAHRLTEADTYNGYYLPKGATVFANTWALLHDEEYYPDPDRFNPDRFLKNGKIDRKLCEAMPNFGYGRRICPGRNFAMDSLHISIASILTVFNIRKARDEHGQVIEPEIEYIPGYTRHIRPFKCNITPRSPEVEKLIHYAARL